MEALSFSLAFLSVCHCHLIRKLLGGNHKYWRRFLLFHFLYKRYILHFTLLKLGKKMHLTVFTLLSYIIYI